MKIVVLEADNAGKDIEFRFLEKYGEVQILSNAMQDEVKELIKDADIILPNKLKIDESVLSGSKVKMVCEMATGYNNIDIQYCKKQGIRVTNVSGYSTDSVAQHTVALLLTVYEKLSFYNAYVKNGEYTESGRFSCIDNYFHEIKGKTWGIVGLGAIGRRTAELAEAFGANVICYSASGKKYDTKYEQVDFENLLSKSDIISVHAPLNEFTNNLFDKDAFIKMKKTAVIINVGRGPIVSNEDLAWAIKNDEIMAAGLDVFDIEPIAKDNPLLEIKDDNRLFMTPHIAWGTVEARNRLVEDCDKNIQAFINGEQRNVIV